MPHFPQGTYTHKSSITTDVKNLAASVTAGGNLNMKAGQDVNIIGSTATAGKDINVDVGGEEDAATSDLSSFSLSSSLSS
mgnify:CR=1 FL=1